VREFIWRIRRFTCRIQSDKEVLCQKSFELAQFTVFHLSGRLFRSVVTYSLERQIIPLNVGQYPDVINVGLFTTLI